MVPRISFAACVLLASLPIAARVANPQAAQPAGVKTHNSTHPAAPVTLSPIEVKARKPAKPAIGTLTVYGNAPLHDTPASIAVIGHTQIVDRQIRSLAALPQLDAAVGVGYASSIGYVQNLTIRGYPLNFATGYRINNLTVTGQQFFGFEDKQEVQILQGLTGIAAGVMEPAGVVNFVTKQPADVHTLTLGTDNHGSQRAALDVGTWLTPNFGLRANVAVDEMRTYVQHARGHRQLYSLAAEWRISPSATLMLNTEQQWYAQRSVPAYQLLGGVALPQHVNRHQMLAYEPWQLPTGMRIGNSSARLRWHLDPAWQLHLALGHSRSVIQDNETFPYGCTGAPGCGPGPTPAAWFAANGNYDIWDFRSPGETYTDDEGRATLFGRIGTGWFAQDVSAGVDVLHMSTALPGEVFNYIGYANIDQFTPPFYPMSPYEPGPVIPRSNSWERSLFALDRLHFGPHWALAVGGHFTRLTERQWDGNGQLEAPTRMGKFLPQAAILWMPNRALTAYTSFSKGLALGQQAPYWALNAGNTLAPRPTRQIEAGVKYRWRQLELNASVFSIHEPNQLAEPVGNDNFLFVQRGEDVHTGASLSANGQLTRNLGVHASVSWIRARAQGTGIALYQGHQELNVPEFRSTVAMTWRPPDLPQLSLLGSWQHASANPASPDGLVQAPSFNVLNAGLVYRSHVRGHAVIWRLAIDNLTDRFYWTYTGSDGNDSYLVMGAPRLVRLSVEVGL